MVATSVNYSQSMVSMHGYTWYYILIWLWNSELDIHPFLLRMGWENGVQLQFQTGDNQVITQKSVWEGRTIAVFETQTFIVIVVSHVQALLQFLWMWAEDQSISITYLSSGFLRLLYRSFGKAARYLHESGTIMEAQRGRHDSANIQHLCPISEGEPTTAATNWWSPLYAYIYIYYISMHKLVYSAI